jgi:hypothetical protein
VEHKEIKSRFEKACPRWLWAVGEKREGVAPENVFVRAWYPLGTENRAEINVVLTPGVVNKIEAVARLINSAMERYLTTKGA